MSAKRGFPIPPAKWEIVAYADPGDHLERIVVPGGWLYRTVWYQEKAPLSGRDPVVAVSMCFVRDPERSS